MRLSLAIFALYGWTVFGRSLPCKQPKPPKHVLRQNVTSTGFGFSAVPLYQAKSDLESAAPQEKANSTSDPHGVIWADVSGGTCSNPRTRVEWRNYPDANKTAFVDAIQCLMNKASSGNYSGATNRYEDIVWAHQSFTPAVHSNDFFLLWHRYYLWTFERILKKECGFAGTIPWWDETLDAGHFAAAPFFVDEYFGDLPAATNEQPTCVTNGKFAGTIHLGPGPYDQPRCLARAVDDDYSAENAQTYITTCSTYETFSNMSQCVYYGPHANGHIAVGGTVGGVMNDMYVSPSDPTFFMHHAFIDRNYWSWQSVNAARSTTVSGCSSQFQVFDAGCTDLTLDTKIPMAGLVADTTVRKVINTLGTKLCYTYDR